jgi:hypothetical protein
VIAFCAIPEIQSPNTWTAVGSRQPYGTRYT